MDEEDTTEKQTEDTGQPVHVVQIKQWENQGRVDLCDEPVTLCNGAENCWQKCVITGRSCVSNFI
jgi:hypothetical protein